MADLLDVQLGTEPWSPAWDAKVVDVYHRYDIPLIGLLTQHGADYLFYCLLGAGRQRSVWLYAHVAEYEVRLLQEAQGAEFDRLVEAMLLNKNLRVALATENDRIVVTADMPSASSKSELLDRTMNALQAEVLELRRDLEQAEREAGLSRSA